MHRVALLFELLILVKAGFLITLTIYKAEAKRCDCNGSESKELLIVFFVFFNLSIYKLNGPAKHRFKKKKTVNLM